MIRAYYTDRVLLVTGGTGFVGSALIAKVLADLGDEVRRVYVLIRPRRRADGGQVAPVERLQQLYETALFAPLRKDTERWRRLEAKVVPITIDERQADLGLAAEDRQRLMAEVDTIFNSAATVVFDEPLDISVQANVGGPQALLDLVHESGRQIDFVHVSTAYVNGQRSGAIPDEVLPVNRNMQQVMDAAAGVSGAPEFDPAAEITDCQAFALAIREEAASEAFTRDLKRDILRQYPRTGGRRMTRKRLEGLVVDRRSKWIERRLVDEGMRRGKAHGWTDVYTYTKAMGEQMLMLRRGQVPLVIVRPSIIESSLEDPEPGWITGLKVMDPLLAAYGRGLIPDFPARPDVIIDVIPVDIVVNGCLTAATTANSDQVEVFHIATGGENPVTIGAMFESVRSHYQRLPMTDMGDDPPDLPAWSYPSLRTFRLVFHLRYLYPIRAREWALNHVPGRKASPRQKRLLRSLRVRLQRVLYYIDIYSPYTHLDCQFQTGRTRALFDSLPEDEGRTFNLDVTRIDWPRYIEDIHLPGMRRHVLRDEFAAEAVLPEAPEEPGVEEARLQDEDEIDTIPDLVRAACARHPEAVACEMQHDSGWTSLSYAELLERVEARAGAWQGLGLNPGDRVVIAGDNGPEWMLAYLAVSFLGGAVVPIDPQTPADEIARIVDFTDAAALVAVERQLQAVRPAWTGLCIEWGVDTADGGGPTPALHDVSIEASMEASIIFTSGIRVDPRGVVLTHGNLIADVLGLSEVHRLAPEDRRLSMLPLHHGLEFTGGLLLTLWSGASTTYLNAPLNSRRILETIRDRHITALLAVPRMLKILLDRVQRLDGGPAGPNHEVLRSLRLIASGGAPLSDAIYDAYVAAGLAIHNGYGLTEAGPIITVTPYHGSRRGSVGVCLPGVEIRIDAATTPGEGEILVRGPTVMAGYLNRPELTAQVVRDGWLHTGDLGRLDVDGYLSITGRLRELIVTGAGKNVYPAEVEDLFADLPHTDELAVVGVPSVRTMGEEVHGVVVLSSVAGAGDLDAVTQAIRQRVYDVSRDLPTYQRIARVHVWQRPLPRLADGHVDRVTLRAELEREDAVADGVDIAGSLAPWERDIYQRVSDLTGLAVTEVVAHADAPLDTLINSLMSAELLASLSEETATVGLELGHMSLRQLVDRVGPDKLTTATDVTYWAGTMATDTVSRPVATKGHTPLATATGRVLRSFASATITGVDNLPGERPYLLALQTADVSKLAMVLAALHRHCDTMCVLVERQEDLEPLLSSRWSRWFLTGTLAPVMLDQHRGLENGLRAAAAHLDVRRPLLLFPQGLQGTAGRGAGAFKSGVGMLAVELSVPVIPVLVPDTDGVQIRVGAPVDPDRSVASARMTAYEVYRDVAARVRAGLRQLEDTEKVS